MRRGLMRAYLQFTVSEVQTTSDGGSGAWTSGARVGGRVIRGILGTAGECSRGNSRSPPNAPAHAHYSSNSL